MSNKISSTGTLSPLRKTTSGYTILFALITALNYIPGVRDANGLVFGLFQLELKDDLLHFFSGLLAGLSAWHSAKSSRLYLLLFGFIYMGDGILGLITGWGYLDGGIFTHTGSVYTVNWLVRFLMNLPHILIGGLAVVLGLIFRKQVQSTSSI